jgi:hydroxyacylglutathione hydrolase
MLMIRDMEIKVYSLPPIGTNAYLVLPAGSDEAIVVDAPLNAYMTVEKIMVQTGRKVSALLMTHGHWDHTLDAWRFNEAGIPVYGHRGDERLYTQPTCMSAFSIPGQRMEPVRIDHWVEQGTQLSLAGLEIEVREVPGHSVGSVLFWLKDHGVAFSGDAIFAGSIGRTDLPGGDYGQLETSIQTQIYTLPDSTRLLSGHGPETSVQTEKQSNPYFRA